MTFSTHDKGSNVEFKEIKVEIDSTVGVDHGIDGNKANRTIRMIANGGDAVVRVA